MGFSAYSNGKWPKNCIYFICCDERYTQIAAEGGVAHVYLRLWNTTTWSTYFVSKLIKIHIKDRTTLFILKTCESNSLKQNMLRFLNKQIAIL